MLSQEWTTCLQQNERELASAEGNLLLAGPGLKTLYVTSCFHGEGKTTAAVSLAMALAGQSNKRVLLIDGNTHAPRLHDVFGCSRAPGMMDSISTEIESEDSFRVTGYPNLFLLPYGESKDQHGAIKQLATFGDSERLRELFDYIIIDGDTVLGSSQVSLVAKSFDGVLLAVACERTKWEVVQQVKDKILQGGGNVLGVILNRRKYYIPRFFYGRK